MKTEMLLTKDEVQAVLLRYMADEDLLEVACVTKTAEGITVSFEDLELTEAEMTEIVKNATDSTDAPKKESIVVTETGELGIALEADLK